MCFKSESSESVNRDTQKCSSWAVGQWFVDWCPHKLVLQVRQFWSISHEFEGVSDRTTARRAVSGTCQLCQVWLWVLKMKGGPHSPILAAVRIFSHISYPQWSRWSAHCKDQNCWGGVFLFTRDFEVCTKPAPAHSTTLQSHCYSKKIFCNKISQRPHLKLTSKIPTNLPNVPFTPAWRSSKRKETCFNNSSVRVSYLLCRTSSFRTGSKRSKILLVLNQHSHKAKDRNVSWALNIQAFPGLVCFFFLFSYIQTILNSIWRKEKYLRSYSLHTNTVLVTRIFSGGYYSLSNGEHWLWGLAVLPLQNQSLGK